MARRCPGFPRFHRRIDYDYTSPLVWFPTAVAVTEEAPVHRQTALPRTRGVAVARDQDGASHAVDLAALAQGYSLFFGMTDARNVPVGQQIGMQSAFGGYPFPADNGLPDGQDTPHDRALAAMRVAFVDLDRIHRDPATNVIVDTATMSGGSGGAIVRGTTASTVALGHVVVGLRHLLMACNAAVTQYGAPDGDPTKDAVGISEQRADPSAGGHGCGVAHLQLARAAAAHGSGRTSSATCSRTRRHRRQRRDALDGVWTPSAGAAIIESQGAALACSRRGLVSLRRHGGHQVPDRARAVARSS